MAARITQPGKDRKKGQPEKDSQNRTARTGQPEQDRQERTGGTGPGLAGQDRQTRRARWQERAVRIR